MEQMTRADVSKYQKLGCYNAFVRLWHRSNSRIRLSYSHEEIAVCLRQGLFDPAKEIRAASLRCFRYFCCDASSLAAMMKVHVDYLVARSLDICLDNDIERMHAMRLIRKTMSVSPERFPSSLLTVMVSIANDGNKEHDKLVKTCLASISELALSNPSLVIQHGGISTILRNILDCNQLPRISESLVATILLLLNMPQTRCLIKPDVDLSLVLAPFTDLDYKYIFDSEDVSGLLVSVCLIKQEGKDITTDNVQLQYDSCRMALSTMSKSWSGIFRLCMPDGSALTSLMGMLHLPHSETRKEIVDVLYDIFCLPLPKWTDCFAEAILSIEFSDESESWILGEGFIAQEGKFLLPNLAKTRPNLIDNHRAFLLTLFLKANLSEALIEAICTSDMLQCVRTVILLGQLLHMSNSCLPESKALTFNCLPELVLRATNSSLPPFETYRAKVAISCLRLMSVNQSRGGRRYSIYLRHLLYCMQRKNTCLRPCDSLRDHATESIHQDSEVCDGGLCMMLAQCLLYKYVTYHHKECEIISEVVRDSHVLYTKDNQSWNWQIVSTILKWSDESMKKVEAVTFQRFIQRILYFFKPSNKIFSVMELTREDQSKITLAGLDLIEFLVNSSTDFSEKCIQEFLKDIASCLSEITEPNGSFDGLFAPSNLLHTCSQFYFLFIGHFSSIGRGRTFLDEFCIFQMLTEMMCSSVNELYVKLVISCLDYSADGPARAILSRALTNTSENSRLYATSLLRVLLRAVSSTDFLLTLLVQQLDDSHKPVSMLALSLLSEACEDPVNLQELSRLNLSLNRFGFKGELLHARFLSREQTFLTLSASGVVASELSKWAEVYNSRYVEVVEERMSEAFTTYEKTFDGSYVRRSHRRMPRKDVFVPVHLYGQLVQHEAGTKCLASQPSTKDIFDLLRVSVKLAESHVKQFKAALWAVGHIGRSVWGVELLNENGLFPCIIRVVETSEVYSLRGTAYYVLGMLASTRRGADILREHGWESVCRAREAFVVGGTVLSADELTLPTGEDPAAGLPAASDRAAFIVADDDEFSGFMRRFDNKASLSSSNSKRPRSLLSSVSEGHSNRSSPIEPDTVVSLDTGPVLNNVDVASSPTEEAVVSISVQSCEASGSFLSSDSSTRAVESSASSLEMSSSFSLDQSDEAKQLSVSNVESRSSFPLRSHLTLPQMTQASGLSKDDQLESETARAGAKRLMSAQDLSGYMKLRDLRHPAAADAAGSMPNRYVMNNTGDVDSYKARSLDFRMSRLRNSFRGLINKSSFKEKSFIPGGGSFRQRKTGPSMDLLNLLGTARNKMANGTQSRLAASCSFGFNQAEYVGISLPVDITRLFKVSGDKNTKPATNVRESLECATNTECFGKALDTQSQLPEKDCVDRHNPNSCLGCYRIYNQQDLKCVGDHRPACREDGVPCELSTVHQEIIRLVIRMSSSVGVKNCEQSLLILKQKFSSSFRDVCLYSEICYILANYSYRLTSRRFIQELFHDVDFQQCLLDPHYLCGIPKRAIPAETCEQIESDFS